MSERDEVIESIAVLEGHFSDLQASPEHLETETIQEIFRTAEAIKTLKERLAELSPWVAW